MKIPASELKAVREKAKSVKGWLGDAEACLLYRLAKRCGGRGVIVEIGSWKGKSTIWLASGSRAGSGQNVYAIDPHIGSFEHQALAVPVDTFALFSANIEGAGVADLVTPIVEKSADAARDFEPPVEMIFIDGAHEYEAVKLDFELWFPKVIDGGFMAFHDSISWPGPRRLVADSVFKSKYFRHAHWVGETTWAQKVAGGNTLRERAHNRSALLLKTAYEKRGLLPAPLRIIGGKLRRGAKKIVSCFAR